MSHNRVRRFVGVILTLGLVIGTASPVWAWGDLGHKIICEIAFQELNDRARNEVIRYAVASAPGGFLEGRCLRMAPYVTVTGTGSSREALQRANVAYALWHRLLGGSWRGAV